MWLSDRTLSGYANNTVQSDVTDENTSIIHYRYTHSFAIKGDSYVNKSTNLK